MRIRKMKLQRMQIRATQKRNEIGWLSMRESNRGCSGLTCSSIKSSVNARPSSPENVNCEQNQAKLVACESPSGRLKNRGKSRGESN